MEQSGKTSLKNMIHNMPRVSVLSIAKNVKDFDELSNELQKQSFQDFEFIGESGEPIPETWNRAIQQANGEILVFVEVGARPVNECWLEELVTNVVDEYTIVKGLEVTSTPLDPSSLAGYRQAFIDHPFDEGYTWSEDTELFCRLKENGYNFIQLDRAPVIHLAKPGSKTFLRRSFRYGLFWSRLQHRYSDPVELTSISQAIKNLIASFLNLTGMLLGNLFFRIGQHNPKK